MKEKERGSITIEATLVLTIFIMAYMCMMSLVQMVRAQTILQYVVDQAALDISRNTYLLTKTGITGQLYDTSEKGKKFEGDTADVIGKVKKLYSSLGAVAASDYDNVIQNTEGALDAADNAATSIKEYTKTYMGSKDEIWSTLTTWGKMKAENFLENETVRIVVESRVEKQLQALGGRNADEYLRHLGVKNGMRGLNFKGTEWMQANGEGKPGVRIEMSYEMEFNWYYFLIKDLKYKVTAYTAVW
ncbi:MAG: pilus assembly protein [Roseburia sp.]|nr:pilus assembly protein [Roseburia sp.]MCM1278553.1 pilus assembly protein [Robinsoniella sp.]